MHETLVKSKRSLPRPGLFQDSAESAVLAGDAGIWYGDGAWYVGEGVEAGDVRSMRD